MSPWQLRAGDVVLAPDGRQAVVLSAFAPLDSGAQPLDLVFQDGMTGVVLFEGSQVEVLGGPAHFTVSPAQLVVLAYLVGHFLTTIYNPPFTVFAKLHERDFYLPAFAKLVGDNADLLAALLWEQPYLDEPGLDFGDLVDVALRL